MIHVKRTIMVPVGLILLFVGIATYTMLPASAGTPASHAICGFAIGLGITLAVGGTVLRRRSSER